MSLAEKIQERIEAAIVVDEIGIETGRYGSHILKTRYQAIFRRTPEGLTPWGVTGTVQPHLRERPISLDSFWADIAPDDQPFVESLGRMLQLRNHRSIHAGDLVLLWDYDQRLFASTDTPEAQVARLVSLLPSAEIDQHLFLCRLPGNGEEGRVAELAAVLQLNGIATAVEDFGTPAESASRIRQINPQIVTFEGRWFRRIADVPAAVDLLGSFVEALRREGRQVLIEGIETPDQLRAAFDTGADLLRGDLLRPAQPVGVIFDTEPLDGEALLLTRSTGTSPLPGQGRPA